jgi:hypothetical protein
VLYRIIGNDLPPRHERGQSLRSLRFILENEPVLLGCEKRFVVNRIVDAAMEAEIIDLLDEFGMPYLHLPFDPEAYRSAPLDFDCLPRKDYLESRSYRRLPYRHQVRLLTAVNRHRNNYVMHNNGARNAAQQDGLNLAKWALPFDGNCFFTESAWSDVVAAVQGRPWLSHFVVPMARMQDNQDLLDRAFVPEANEEPQLIFRSDSQEVFNEAFPYGRFPKIELFWRLGIPGNWSYTVEKAWDPARRPISAEAYRFGLAGWVARLDSGVGDLEQPGVSGPSKRGDARREAILDLLERLDHAYLGESLCAKYRPKHSDDVIS